MSAEGAVDYEATSVAARAAPRTPIAARPSDPRYTSAYPGLGDGGDRDRHGSVPQSARRNAPAGPSLNTPSRASDSRCSDHPDGQRPSLQRRDRGVQSRRQSRSSAHHRPSGHRPSRTSLGPRWSNRDPPICDFPPKKIGSEPACRTSRHALPDICFVKVRSGRAPGRAYAAATRRVALRSIAAGTTLTPDHRPSQRLWVRGARSRPATAGNFPGKNYG